VGGFFIVIFGIVISHQETAFLYVHHEEGMPIGGVLAQAALDSGGRGV
jgi:hypothetical protein